MKRLLSLLFFTIGCCCVKAQFPPVTIPGSEIRKITSSIVKGQEYELQILLPSGYKESNKKYPVVFLMDSQWDFPLVKSIYGQQYYDGFIPEVIIVGITWGGANPNPDSLRARDYTPTKENRLVQSGGAGKFLDFMKQELFPFLDSNFRVDNNQRILMGCSLGGLFTLYSMFTHTDMFTGYVAASPAVAWDNNVLYKFEKEFSLHKTIRPVRLYLTVGDVEKGNNAFKKISGFITNRHYPNVYIRSKILENTGHSGTKSETYNRGLQFIFEKAALSLTNNILQLYTGSYTDADGNKVEIKSEKSQLVISSSQGERELLKYAGNNLFYSNAGFLNLIFSQDGKTFQLNQFGKSSMYRRR
jgi:predicted alpha/beta superfamily hydrolase